jgi:hypothetical protein
MKPFISPDEMQRLERDALERGELLANVFVPLADTVPVRGPVVDESGRTWSLPGDVAGMTAVWQRYVRLHGRLSSSVDRTFLRHDRLDELRMLVMRCAEGEPINLAARALALGPVPPPTRPKSWPAGRPWPHDVFDAQALECVQAEARRMRGAGYVD